MSESPCSVPGHIGPGTPSPSTMVRMQVPQPKLRGLGPSWFPQAYKVGSRLVVSASLTPAMLSVGRPWVQRTDSCNAHFQSVGALCGLSWGLPASEGNRPPPERTWGTVAAA